MVLSKAYLLLYPISISVSFFQMLVHIWVMDVITISGHKISFSEWILFTFTILLLYFYTKKVKINNFTDSRAFALMFLLVFVFISVLLSEDPQRGVVKSIIFLSYVFLYFYIFVGHVNIDSVENTIRFLFFIGIIFALYASFLYFFQNVIDSENEIVISTNRGDINVQQSLYDFGFGAVKGIFIPGLNTNTFGVILTSLVFICLFLYSECRNRKYRIFYFSILLLFLSEIVMTMSRGALLSLFLGIFYLIIKGWFNVRQLLLYAIILMVIMTYFQSNHLDAIYQRFLGGVDLIFNLNLDAEYGIGFVDRIESQKNTINIFYDNPIFGVGAGNLDGYNLIKNTEHNSYLRVLAELGLFGFMALLLFIVGALRSASIVMKKIRNIPDLSKDLKMLEMLFAISITYVFYLNIGPFLHSFWISIALLSVTTFLTKKKLNLLQFKDKI